MPLTIAGVPEHFNAPWKYAIEKELFLNKKLDVEFVEYSTGTGSMCADLSNEKLDLAIVLTEGICQYQKTDPTLKLVSTYVDSPLLWGIHIHQDSDIHSVEDLQDKNFAISRKGSGSHLMVKLLAQLNGWDFSQMTFTEIGSITQLGNAIQNRNADVFLWETFTTKPYFDRYQLRCLDILPTPWPCFQIVAREDIYQKPEIIHTLCDVIFSVTPLFNQNQDIAIDTIEKYYHLDKSDVQAWLKTVHWCEQKQLTDFSAIEKVLFA